MYNSIGKFKKTALDYGLNERIQEGSKLVKPGPAPTLLHRSASNDRLDPNFCIPEIFFEVSQIRLMNTRLKKA